MVRESAGICRWRVWLGPVGLENGRNPGEFCLPEILPFGTKRARYCGRQSEILRVRCRGVCPAARGLVRVLCRPRRDTGAGPRGSGRGKGLVVCVSGLNRSSCGS
jgi:hypothetical protein